MTSIKQASFSGGEIAPSLYARADLVKYATGLRTCRNFVVARHGGVFNRPGTKYICDVRDYYNAPRLIPFVFNSDQTYVLEFGDETMRVIREGVLLTEATQSITGATNANPCVVTATAHGYSDGDEVSINNVGGMTELNGRNFKVANATANTFSLQTTEGVDVVSTGYGTYTTGGDVARVYEIATPYFIQDLAALQFAQSADVMTLVHPSYAPRELTRTGHTSWSLNTITFAPVQAAPTSLAVSGTAGGNTYIYHVTAVAGETYEESLAATITKASVTAPGTNAHTISWAAATGAVEYNVYLEVNGVPAYVGTSIGTSHVNTTNIGDLSTTPPVARNPFGSAGNYPSAVGYFQQRRVFANTTNNPETVWASRTGLPANFTITSPPQDDDSVTFTLAGKQVNAIRHLIEVNRLVALTSGGEWSISGDSAGTLRPTDINARQQAYNGASTVIPLIVNGTVVYVQSRGTIVRDLGFDFSVDGYRGNDLTIFATHLFDKYTIQDWAFQQIPHSIVWAVRNDGTLLGMTYIREHEVLAWHRHDFGGVVEAACVVPEGTEDYLYLAVKRGGRRTIERMVSRNYQEINDAVFVDAALSYDGRNTDPGLTMTVTGGTAWTYDELLTMTASSSFFTAGDVGNGINITTADGDVVRFIIASYTSSTVVGVRCTKTVPVSIRGAATDNWAKAVDELTNLWHLEGQEVSVFADGFVVANPTNDSYDVLTVANGTVTLDRPYSVIHVGLPITADLETLDLENVSQETMSDKNKLVTAVTIFVEASRGIWVGSKPPTDDTTDPLEGLHEVKLRDTEDDDDPVDLETGPVKINIRSEWNNNGRVFVRQVDPVPLSILSIVPAGFILSR
jgi:hypothetical protein